jgi:serine/threonine protein kinase
MMDSPLISAAEVEKSYLQGASQRAFDDAFEPIHVAGVGFFGVVMYALTKQNLQLEGATMKDRKEGLQNIVAVKICRPGCPSGIRDSAKRLIAEIEAMRCVKQNMKDSFRHYFAELYEHNTSQMPWYSMEPILSKMTLDSLCNASKTSMLPVPEALAFHLVDQVARAYHFLHHACKIVRLDANPNNIMLRYPGRETPLMPDIVLIDWSLWREASEQAIRKDTQGLYECIYPALCEAGWLCGGSHDRDLCVAYNINHSVDWIHLQDKLHKKQRNVQSLYESILLKTKAARQKIREGSEEAEEIMSFMHTARDPPTEAALSKGEMIHTMIGG